MQNRYISVCLVLFIVVGVLFLIRSMLFPCLMSVIIAYLFNPLVVKFEEYRIRRLYSVIIIIFSLLAIFILIIAFVLPSLYIQIVLILKLIVSEIPSLKTEIAPVLLELFNMKTDNLLEGLSKSLLDDDYIRHLFSAFNFAVNLIMKILSSSFNLMNALPLVIITPVTFFYALRDWPFIMTKAKKLIPTPYKEKAEIYFSRVDFIVSNYLKGQINVCIIMLIFYSIGLGVLGLKHFIVIGILSGTLTFIPYIGPLVYTTIGFLSAIIQFDRWFESFAILLLFLVGQLIDSNILVPWLVGKKVHMHSVTIMLGVTVCTAYLGLFGILFFIPTLAVLYVSVEFLLDKYTKSEFYKSG